MRRLEEETDLNGSGVFLCQPLLKNMAENPFRQGDRRMVQQTFAVFHVMMGEMCFSAVAFP
jgi:hypothetical protein